MHDTAATTATAAAVPALAAAPLKPGLRGVAADFSSDQRAFKRATWHKAMMWIFLLSDTFVFSCFLISYMTVRMSTVDTWPNASAVFSLSFGGEPIPLILIAIMTFVLISSSGTMAMAVNCGYARDRKKTVVLMLLTAALGATFVGMQAFEWSKLIEEGVRPWGNEWGAPQFGSIFFTITGFHGTHVTIGVIWLATMFYLAIRGKMTPKHAIVLEMAALYWHFVDVVWIVIFPVVYLIR
jgi:cytochrome c oxidase subunit 3